MEQNKNNLDAPTRLWTEPTVRRLVGLWRERISATRIASALGPDFSRSAVVGKLARMGLRCSDEQRRDALVASGHQTRRMRPPALPPIPLPPSMPCAVVPRLASILELGPHDCRWPCDVGEETRFCGCRVAPEGTYCPGHRAIAYDGTLPPLTLEMLGASGSIRHDR